MCWETMVSINLLAITMSFQSNFYLRWATGREDKEDAEEIIHVTWPMKTFFALVMKFSWNFLSVNMDLFKYVPWPKERIYCIPHAQPLSLKWSRGSLTDTRENLLLLKRIEHWNRFVTSVELPLLFFSIFVRKVTGTFVSWFCKMDPTWK